MIVPYEIEDDDVVVGLVGARHCPACDEDREFILEAYYRCYSIGFVVNWIGRVRPFLACSNCGAQYVSDGGRDERRAIKREISWWRRWGWAASLAAVIALLGLRAGLSVLA